MKFSLIPCVLVGLACSPSSALVSSRWKSDSKPRQFCLPQSQETSQQISNLHAVWMDPNCLHQQYGLGLVVFRRCVTRCKVECSYYFLHSICHGISFLPSPMVTQFELHSLLPNGTIFNVFIPAEEAVITTEGKGRQGL